VRLTVEGIFGSNTAMHIDPIAWFTPEMARAMLAAARLDLLAEDDDDDDDISLAELLGQASEVVPRPGRSEPRSMPIVSVSRFEIGKRAARLGAVMAALVGDVGALPALLEVKRALQGMDDEHDFEGSVMMMGIARIAWRGPPPDDLLTHPSVPFRLGLAHGLSPVAARSREQLLLLAVDVDPCVRRTARTSLPKALCPPWWHGTFESEPDGAPVLMAGLAAIGPFWDKPAVAGFVAAWRALPEAARLWSAERLYSPLLGYTGLTEPLLEEVMRVPGGEVALVRIIARHANSNAEFRLERVLERPGVVDGLFAERRAAIRSELTAFILTPQPAAPGRASRSRRTAAKLLVALLELDADLVAHFELVTTLASSLRGGLDSAFDCGLTDLVDVLKDKPIPAIVERVVDMWRAGFPGCLTFLRNALLPEVKKALGAEQLALLADELMAGDDQRRELGVELALSLGQEPASLTARPGIAGLFAPDGLYRRVCFGAHRLALRAGLLAPGDVVRVVDSIDHRYRGRLSLSSYELQRGEAQTLWQPPNADPSEIQGPCSDAERSLYEAAVAALLAATDDPVQRLAIAAERAVSLAPGPWQPGERERLAAVIEPLIALANKQASQGRARRPDARSLLGSVAVALAQKGERADMPMLGLIAGQVPDDNEEILAAVVHVRARFGGEVLPRRFARARVRPTTPVSDATPSSLGGLPREVARGLLSRFSESKWHEAYTLLDPDFELADESGRRRSQSLALFRSEIVKGSLWALADGADEASWRAAAAVSEDEPDDSASVCGIIDTVLDWLFERADGSSAEVLALAGHPDVAVRRALVGGLDASIGSCRARLFALLDDRDRVVRERALEALKGYELPWWRGTFSRDPLAELTPEEAAQHAPTFAAFQELMAGKVTRRAELTALAALVREMPEAAVIDVVPRLLPAMSEVRIRHAPLITALLRVAGGYAVWSDLVARIGDEDSLDNWERVAEAVGVALCGDASVTSEARLEVGQAALMAVRKRSARTKSLESERRAVHAALLVTIWPNEVDPDAIVDLWLGSRSDLPVESQLDTLIEKQVWQRGWASTQRIIAAAKAGFAEPWHAWTDRRLLGRLPDEERRALALELRHAPDEARRAWALRELLVHSPRDEDGAVADQVAEFVADDTSRAALMSDPELATLALPLFEARVLAGLCTMGEATTILNFAGCSRSPELVGRWRAMWRDEVLPLADQAGRPERQDAVHHAIMGAIEDEDRAFLERVVRDASESEAFAVMWRLREKGEPQDLPLARVIVTRFPDDEDLRRSLGRMVARHQAD